MKQEKHSSLYTDLFVGNSCKQHLVSSK